MWSKAERQAIAELHRFADTGSPDDYLRFRGELAVPLGDRAARLELQSPDPDFALARSGFLAGRNHPDDVPGMMLLFRLFSGTPRSSPGPSAHGRAPMSSMTAIG